MSHRWLHVAAVARLCTEATRTTAELTRNTASASTIASPRTSLCGWLLKTRLNYTLII